MKFEKALIHAKKGLKVSCCKWDFFYYLKRDDEESKSDHWGNFCVCDVSIEDINSEWVLTDELFDGLFMTLHDAIKELKEGESIRCVRWMGFFRPRFTRMDYEDLYLTLDRVNKKDWYIIEAKKENLKRKSHKILNRY